MNPNPSHVASDALDHNMDNRIDRALSGLRDAQPRSGLNSRILISLEHRTAAPATNPGGLLFHGLIVKGWGIARGSTRESGQRTGNLAVWSATAAAILAVGSLVVLHHSLPNKNTVMLSGARSAESKDPDTARPTTNSAPFSTANPAVTSAEPTHRTASLATATMPAVCTHGCPIHDGAAVMGGGTTTSTDFDAQALADLHAPSHPAPPLPLTPQEKLFLQVLRYGNLTQLAELNPMVRAQQDAAETTAFKAFFPDPPPLKQPGDNE